MFIIPKRAYLYVALIGVTLLCAGCSAPQRAQAASPAITLKAVGDIAFTGGHGQSLGTPSALLKYVAPTLKKSDITFGNLETSLSRRGTKWNKAYTFRGPVTAGPALNKAGFDVMSLANNHTLDYGRGAFADTLRVVRRSGMLPVGAGMNKKEAWEPEIVKREGKRIAFLAFSEITPGEFAATSTRSGTAYTQSISAVTAAVRRAHKRADYVVVSMHWGVEKSYDPTYRQRKEAHAIIRAGADAVLGHHPHRIQGVEKYRGKLIAYSLANFVFSPASAGSTDTYILSFTFKEGKVVKATARPVSIRQGTPHLVSLSSTAGKRISNILIKKSKAQGMRCYKGKSSVIFKF